MGSPKNILGISRQIFDRKRSRQGKKRSGSAKSMACNKDRPLYVFITIALRVKALIKMQKGCETLRQLVNDEKIILVDSLWEHNFIQSYLPNHLFVVFAWKIFSMFATSINGRFSNQLYQWNGKSLFI
jgi:hypothetical protein